MGLDMTLIRKYYVKNWDFMEDSDKHEITISEGGKPSSIPVDKIIYIETEEIRWRKANAIHQWFVENVQDGQDDCGTYFVDDGQLQELLDLCSKVLDNSKLEKAKVYNGETIGSNGGKIEREVHWLDGEAISNPEIARELLPTQSGFFFGETDYDQYYIEDLKHTQAELKRILAEEKIEGEFYYHSSW